MAVGGGYGSSELVRVLAARSRLLGRLARALYPPMPTLNVMPREVLERVRRALFFPNAVVLDLGAGGLAGCGRRLWRPGPPEAATVFRLDLVAGADVEVVGDAHLLPLGDESVDAVVMQAVLEHVVDPRRAIAEVGRILKPGGYVYVEMPFLQGFHADPHDYQRYTLPGLRHRLAAFEDCESGVSVGPFCTLVWLLRDGVSGVFANRWLYGLSRLAMGWLSSPIRYLDFLVRATPMAERLANEFYFLGRKPGGRR